jgi:hypothetical protein
MITLALAHRARGRGQPRDLRCAGDLGWRGEQPKEPEEPHGRHESRSLRGPGGPRHVERRSLSLPGGSGRFGAFPSVDGTPLDRANVEKAFKTGAPGCGLAAALHPTLPPPLCRLPDYAEWHCRSAETGRISRCLRRHNQRLFRKANKRSPGR